jgi:exodeoxyribonuclease V alpha subunit
LEILPPRTEKVRADIPQLCLVDIPVPTQHFMMLQRDLLYTGLTRGKRLVILLGQKKAVVTAVKNVSGRRRWTKLRERLNPV